MNQIAAIKAPQPVAESVPGRQAAVSASAQGVKTGEIAPENTVPPPQRVEAPRPRATKPKPDVALEAAKAAPSAPVGAGTAATQETQVADLQPAARRTVKNIEFSAETRDVIFQSLSEDTGEVVAQVPSEALLRIREYVRGKAPDGPSGLLRLTA